MAKQSVKKTEGAGEGDAPRAKGGSKKLIIIAAAAVLVLAGGGGAAWFLLRGKSDHAPEVKHKPPAVPVFVTLEPFVVNMAGEVQHFMQVGIDLRVAEASVSDQIKQHLPEIRNGVLLLLSSKKVEDVASIEQKNYLRDEIRAAVNKPLGIVTPLPKRPAPPAAPAEGEAVPPSGEAHAAETPKADAHKEDAHKDDGHKSDTKGEPAAEKTGVLEVLLTSFVIQ